MILMMQEKNNLVLGQWEKNKMTLNACCLFWRKTPLLALFRL